MIDFPQNPTQGQQFTAAGVTWTWDGTKWTASGLGVAYLPLAGGTMLGPIVLAADPAAPLQAATKQYVDGARWGDNRIINGDMRIDQRNNGNFSTANGYTVDRWQYAGSQAGKITWCRSLNTIVGPPTFPYYLGFQATTPYALTAGDYFFVTQPVEADMIGDFAWGTPSALPITLSFWAYSNQTGTFGGALRNYGTPQRSYPFTYSLPTANTWTRITITIPGDTTAGAWTMSGNGGALYLRFDLGTGATNRGPAGAWASADYIGATGTVNIVPVNNATFYLTGVKLEIGSVATPFNRQSLAKSLADCQRYYQLINVSVGGYGVTGTSLAQQLTFMTQMRAMPTLAWAVNGSGNNVTGTTADSLAINGFRAIANISTTGNGYWTGAQAALSAEL